MEFGYCRISTGKQSIERQVRNILAAFPNAKIYKEIFTGTKKTGRKELKRILDIVWQGDTIIFDSVSRMSRNAQEGIDLYMELYDKGINLVFLKEPHINTDTYRAALEQSIGKVGNDIEMETMTKHCCSKAVKGIVRVKASADTCSALPHKSQKAYSLGVHHIKTFNFSI